MISDIPMGIPKEPLDDQTTAGSEANTASPLEDGTTQSETTASQDQRILGLLPFTVGSVAPPFYGLDNPYNETQANRAFAHMAAALLAADHFNARNPAIVPELAQLDCEFALPPFLFENTDSDPYKTARILAQRSSLDLLAIVGPYTNECALTAATYASGWDVPMVSHGFDDFTLTRYQDHPRATNTAVNLHAMGEVVVNYALAGLKRSEALATIHVTREIGDHYNQAAEDAAQEIRIDGRKFGSYQAHTIAPPFVGEEPRRIGYVLRAIKASGVRNIFLVVLSPRQLPAIADAAEQYGMNTKDYTWILGAPRATDLGEVVDVARGNDNMTKLVNGMAHIGLLDGFDKTPFLSEWKTQNATFVERVNQLHPIKNPQQPGYYQAPDCFFATHDPLPGAGFMYDAVMSVALGKCGELEAKGQGQGPNGGKGASKDENGGENNNRQRKGIRGLHQKPSPSRRRLQKGRQSGAPKNPLHEAIMDTEFHGATGQVKYRESWRFPGSRKRNTTRYGAYNFRPTPDNSSLWYYLTDIHHGDTMQGNWEQTAQGPFVFANGLTTPPFLNRDLPEQNFLSQGVQIAGLFLMGTALLCSILSATYVQVRKTKDFHIVQAQPPFLMLLIIGTMVLSLAILPLSFDDSYVSESVLDGMCMATPWLVSLGYNCIYLALFSKLWRLDKVMQFRRVKVKVRHVLLPFAANILATVSVLIAWTIIDPQKWVREEIDSVTFETYGKCQSNSATGYWIILFSLMIISTGACGLMAFKCRDIDKKYSDSNSIFHTIFVQIQVLLVGVPVVGLLDDASAGATYLAKVMLTFVISMSTLIFMIVPKMLRSLNPSTDVAKRSVGTGAVHVSVGPYSGITMPQSDGAGFPYPKASMVSTASEDAPFDLGIQRLVNNSTTAVGETPLGQRSTSSEAKKVEKPKHPQGSEAEFLPRIQSGVALALAQLDGTTSDDSCRELDSEGYQEQVEIETEKQQSPPCSNASNSTVSGISEETYGLERMA